MNTPIISKRNEQLTSFDGTLFNIPIFSKSKADLLKQVQKCVEKHQPFVIHTVYSEMMLEAIRNSQYRRLLKTSDANVIDGISIEIARRYVHSLRLKKTKSLLSRVLLGISTTVKVQRELRKGQWEPIRGRKLFYDLLKFSVDRNIVAVFIGDEKGNAEEARKKLLENYSNARIITFDGPHLDRSGTPYDMKDLQNEEKIIDTLQGIQSYKFIFVGLGVPKQEIWINRMKGSISPSLWIGVGGTFDYVIGKMKKPPRIVELNGLEWLWRMIQEPKRIPRIWNAVVVFPWKIVRFRE